VACGQYVRQHLEPCGPDQSTKEKEAHHTVLRAVLSGDWPESAVVHGSEVFRFEELAFELITPEFYRVFFEIWRSEN
jgi:hypothetical protein